MAKGAFREYLSQLGKSIIKSGRMNRPMCRSYRKWKIIQLYKTRK